MKYIILTLGLFITNLTFGQHLYPEKFNQCKLSKFCLDCGDTKAEPPQKFIENFISNLNKKSLKKINGFIDVQILVDSIGNPCLLSAKNETNIKSKKLKLQNGIANSGNWSPAISKGKFEKVSISLQLNFNNGNLSIKRREFDFSKNTNFKSVGTSDIKGTKESKLSETWTVYNQQNSNLPWDMTRSIAVDNNNIVWVATDNGIARIEKDNIKVYNSSNSSIIAKRGKSFTKCLTIDSNDNIWFSDGYNGYKFDKTNWTVYDTISTPLRWTTGIKTDKKGNVYFKTFKGLRKFDGTNWTIIDKSNTNLPAENISDFFIDNKNRTWIGTYKGNIRIEGETTIQLKNSDNPLSESTISKIYEDKKGNLWFDLYNKEDKSKAGMFILRTNGEWESIRPKNSKLFSKNDINDFLLDEEKNILWIALNSVGLIKYDLINEKWEIYTTENSNIPSIHVMKLAMDKEGIIWGATFAGIIKLNKK